MAPHSSTLAWKIPWTEEPGGPQSMGLLRVRHDWATSLLLFTFMHWRREWQPTPVFLPGESQGWWSLVGCHLWGCTVRYDWSDLAAAAAGQWQSDWDPVDHTDNWPDNKLSLVYSLLSKLLSIPHFLISLSNKTFCIQVLETQKKSTVDK